MCPHWGIADGEAPRSQPHKIVPAKGTRNGLRSCRRRDPRGTNIILRKQRRRYLRWHNVLNAMEREREEYRQRRVAFLAEIHREVKDTERSCRRVATAAGTAVSIRAPGTARILYKLVHRVLPRLSECPPRAPAVGMACNRPRVVVGAVCSASQSLAEHRATLGRLRGRDAYDQHRIIAVASGPR